VEAILLFLHLQSTDLVINYCKINASLNSCTLAFYDKYEVMYIYFPTKNIYIYIYIYSYSYIGSSGRGSSVGIATGYGLDGPGIESRWG
jgi:hypothetical protein